MPNECATSVLTRTVTVAEGLYAPGHLGELTRRFPFKLIDDVLTQTRAVPQGWLDSALVLAQVLPAVPRLA